MGLQKLILLIFTLFVPTLVSAASCEIFLDPRVQWKAINSMGVLPAGPVGKLVPIETKSTARQGGVWMQDEAGTQWMVKPDKYYQHLTSSAEVISSLIYSHFAILTPVTVKVIIDGNPYAAVRFVGKGLDESLLLYMHTPQFRAMRFAAAYLKDYDRIHTGPNNFIIGQRDFISYDFGGTLGASARGRHKAGAVISDATGAYPSGESFASMYDGFKLTDPTDPNRLKREIPDVPLPDWHPWMRITDQDVKIALKGFQSLTDDLIVKYVQFAAYPDKNDEVYMIKALITNRDAFIEALKNKLTP